MIRYSLYVIAALLIWACSPVKDVSRTSVKLASDSVDSTEYEIVVFDPGFDLWYQTNYSPARDYSNDYYRNKNHIAVVNWNEYYRTGRYARVVDSYIDYQPDIDYGIGVNRTLYWYFKFVEEKYRIHLFWQSQGIR